MAENRCVCCGEVIPEGWQVCPSCEAGKEKERNLVAVSIATCAGGCEMIKGNMELYKRLMLHRKENDHERKWM